MKIEYFADGSGYPRTIETADANSSYAWLKPGVVYDFDGASDEYGPTEFTPDQARAKAAALLRAADEAEGRTPSTAERDLLAFIERAGWDGTDMVAAVRAQVARETRDDVARELDQIDGTNLGMSLVRTQAVRVARSGLEPMDVRRGE